MIGKAGEKTRLLVKKFSTSLRAKATGSVLLSLIGLLAIVFITVRPLIMRGFAEEEQRYAREKMEQVCAILQVKMKTLEYTISDWAVWDDTWNFVQSLNENYIASNLNYLTMENLNLNFMVFLDTHANIVYSLSYDPVRKLNILLPKDLTSLLVTDSPLLNRMNGGSVSGIVDLYDVPLVIASHSILKSDGSGPSRGWLVFARFLDENELEVLRSAGGLKDEIEIFSYRNTGFTSSSGVVDSILSGNLFSFEIINENTIAGYSPLYDIYGNISFIIKVVSDRPVNTLARKIEYYLGWSTFFIIVTLASILVYINEKILLSRITRMIKEVRGIRDINNSDTRLGISSNDELTGLAVSINEMLDRLQAVNQELKSSEQRYRKQAEMLQYMLDGTTRAMAAIVEARDPYTSSHQLRVARLAQAIAQKMGLPENVAVQIYTAGLIHDIGKMVVPAEILAKPGKLSPLEFSLVQMHPQKGHDIVKNIKFPFDIARWILEHHERINGSGYPYGLTGDKLSIESQILAVADVTEAMSAHRPYRASLGLEAAFEEITRHRGVLYYERAVDACIELFRQDNFSFE